MIELRTGLPGNGKTLSVVQELAALQAKWDKGSEDARPVFVHNVKDLALPHSPFPYLVEKNAKTGTERKVPDWSQVPDGSLVIIDECQDLFPPRPSMQEAPPHVAWLNTHRHRGVDIIAITQHPRLVDGALRALVGKHRHYRRAFGGKRAVVYEWDGCSDTLGGMKNAVMTYWPFPADAFKWYKSAEVHTKQKFKLPYWMAIPVIGLLGCLWALPHAYNAMKGTHDRPAKVIDVQAHPVTSTAPAAPGDAGPALAGPQASPGKRPPAPPPGQRAPTEYVGCISRAGACACLRADGVLEDSPEQCEESSRSFGHLVKVAMNSTPGGYNPAAAAVAPRMAAPVQAEQPQGSRVAVLGESPREVQGKGLDASPMASYGGDQPTATHVRQAVASQVH